MFKLNFHIRFLNDILDVFWLLNNAFIFQSNNVLHNASVAKVGLIGLPSSTDIYVWRSSYRSYQ